MDERLNCVKLGAMSLMLPSRGADTARLADVLTSCLDAVRAEPNPLKLPAVRSAIVVLVDGLGLHNLRARAGHARTLMSAVTTQSVAHTVFPATTAAALSTLTTGTEPGQHGIVGYTVRDPASGVVRNQLSGWGPEMPPERWQRKATVFERARAEQLRADAVSVAKHEQSGFTHAVLRGADYVVADGIADRMRRAVDLAKTPGLSYVYVAELDMAAHANGWESAAWLAKLEELDSAVAWLLRNVPAHTGVLLTADHGVLDVAAHRQLLVDQIAPELIAQSVAVSGDPRVLGLHLPDGASESERRGFATLWQQALGDVAWVFSRDEAVALGLYGEVDSEVLPRIADVLIAARSHVAFYDSRSASAQSRAMIGQHGSLTDEEVRVPLLRFGAFG